MTSSSTPPPSPGGASAVINGRYEIRVLLGSTSWSNDYRARDLLRQTSLSVLETALACGFASASHFSRAYRGRFGHSPRAERLPPAATAWR